MTPPPGSLFIDDVSADVIDDVIDDLGDDDADAEGRGVVRVLTLSQPARKNALTPAMLAALIDALPRAPSSSRQPIRAVVLQGAGLTFSSGFDLGALDERERARGVDPITPAADALEACPVPVIAAVEGDCWGGAVELCLAAQLRVASSTATFCVPAVRLGLVYPVSGLRRFRRVLGGNAERVLIGGVPFAAIDARRWGLIHDVVDDARAHALALARSIAGHAPLAVSGTLQALRAVDAGDLAAAEAARQPALQSKDLLEGLLAHKEKRPPVFGGR